MAQDHSLGCWMARRIIEDVEVRATNATTFHFQQDLIFSLALSVLVALDR